MLQSIYLGVIGLLGGISSGLFGVGGGVIFVPLMMILLAFDVHLAIGTSIVAIVPTALVASIKHIQAGMVSWQAVAALVVFSMAGAWLGVTLSLKLDAQVLRKFYAIFLFLVSIKIFFQK